MNPDWDERMKQQAREPKPKAPRVWLQPAGTRLREHYAILRQALEEIYTDVDGSLETCRNRARRALEETDEARWLPDEPQNRSFDRSLPADERRCPVCHIVCENAYRAACHPNVCIPMAALRGETP